MNKQIAKKSTTLNKNMTNTETLTVDNINVLDKICIPIFTGNETPTNPVQGQFYIKRDFTSTLPFEFMIYADGAWN